MHLAQFFAVTIFIVMFVIFISERIPRHIASLGSGVLTLVIVFGLCMKDTQAIWDTLNLDCFVHQSFWYTSGSARPSFGINWETIIFIAGMMIMVEGMADSGFFRWLCISIARAVHFKPVPIFVIFMILSSLLSMFIDSITVIMFLAVVTVELSKLIGLNPAPLIMAEIFCANLGGSATMCGDPPNIIIGTSLGYSFFDFITNTGLIAIISLVVIIVYFYFCFRKSVTKEVKSADPSNFPKPGEAVTSRKGFIMSCIIFSVAVILLVTHAQTGLTVATIGLFIGIVTLVSAGRKALQLLKRIDYQTLIFFTGLFIVVCGLEHTGILDLLAAGIQKISGGNNYLMTAIILWGSSIASAVVDNIPFAATMIPVIRTLSASQGIELSTLAWALSMGTDIGGSATPIGASPNVVGTSIAAKNGYPVSWGKYCRVQIPATLIVLVIATVMIFVRYL